MNIAIIGAGNVGGALGLSWSRSGHTLRFGIRNPDTPELRALLTSIGPRASAHSPADAAKDAQVIVLATPWNATKSAIESCGDLSGKIVVDCTNPLLPALAGLELGHTTSGAERVTSWAKGAAVFKAFNQTGANNMADQKGYAQRLVMFVAGDDATKKPIVLQLAKDAGFEAVDAGPLSIARLLEPLAMLWIHLAVKMGLGRDFGLALVRR